MKDGIMKRVEAAFAKMCVLFVRQSSMSQRLFNQGSGDVQLQQARHLERMNVPEERIITIDARGESGRADVVRHHFEELIRLVTSGVVGVLVLARFDRIGRNREDSNRVLRLLAKCGAMLLIDGKLYDPRQPQDGLSLDMQSSYAEYENKARALWMMVARLNMARRMRTVIPLPTGLSWVNLGDAAVRARLVNAGLGDWLGRAGEHRAVAGYEPAQRHVMPYPDRAVHDAARLRIDWLLETQDTAEVRARIREGAQGWPQRGLVPMIRSSVYGAEKPVHWVPLEDSGINDWYLSPPLYGIYAFTGRALAEADDIPVEENSVWEPRAFPSYASEDDLERVRAILARGASKPWKRMGPPCEHLLPNVRCAQNRDDGSVCGRRMSALGYGGEARYVARCRHSTFNGTASRRIEPVVFDIVAKAFAVDGIRGALETLRCDRDAMLVRRAEARREHANLLARAKAARELAIEERIGGNAGASLAFLDEHQNLEARAAAVARILGTLEAEEAAIRGVTEQDYARVLELAADLPRLLEGAKGDPPAMRRLVGELTRAVHVRSLAHGVVEVEVEFPTGARIRRVVETHPVVSTQPERVYAAGRLAAGASADAVAVELNTALAEHRARAPSTQPFKPGQVVSMAAMHLHVGDDGPRLGEQHSAARLALRLGVGVQEAREAILLGYLGPAGWDGEGDLTVSPTDDEIAWIFVECSRRSVAELRGWPADDTVLASEAAADLGLTRSQVLRRAERCSGWARLPERRVWVRRSEVTDPDAVIRGRLAARRPDLDPQQWERLARAVERTGISAYVLKRYCAREEILWDRGRLPTVYVWLGPGVAEGLRSDFAELAARAAPGRDPAEFMTVAEIVSDFECRSLKVGDWRIRAAAARGSLVQFRGPGRHPRVAEALYVHVPPEVRETRDPAVVKAWLNESDARERTSG